MTEISATITGNGQITIPLEVRRLRLNLGDVVTVEVVGDYAILRAAVSVVEATAGIFRGAEPALDASELREDA